jgi:predicted nucleotidyltransferase
MDSSRYFAILKTICYADIFDYPLTEREVCRWINESEKVSDGDIKKANGVILHKEKFMVMKGREVLIEKRRAREIFSAKKFLIAKEIASILWHIPTLELIGISGSVAMGNAGEDDDIDFFIVTKNKTLWLTRLLATAVVGILGKRRKPGDLDVADKICLNMFVDEACLAVPLEKRNLYTAHEVCQLKVLFERGNTYERFLTENAWVRKFLPNGIVSRLGIELKTGGECNALFLQSLAFLDMVCKRLQLWYMKKRVTKEAITDYSLAFHPNDYTKDVLASFERRLTLYGAHV